MNINSVTTCSIIFVIYIVWSTKRKRKERNDTTAHCALGRAWSRCRVVVVVVSFFFCFFSLVSFLLLLLVFWTIRIRKKKRTASNKKNKKNKERHNTTAHCALRTDVVSMSCGRGDCFYLRSFVSGSLIFFFVADPKSLTYLKKNKRLEIRASNKKEEKNKEKNNTTAHCALRTDVVLVLCGRGDCFYLRSFVSCSLIFLFVADPKS